MKTIFLRHSETTFHADEILAGSHSNPDLSDNGVRNATECGKRLKQKGYAPTVVITSPLARTRQTAKAISASMGITPQSIELSEFTERDFGKYDGGKLQSLLAAFEAEGPNPETVESVTAFNQRLTRGVDKLRTVNADCVLVVAHANVLAAVYCLLLQPASSDTFWEAYHAGYCEGYVVDMQQNNLIEVIAQ